MGRINHVVFTVANGKNEELESKCPGYKCYDPGGSFDMASAFSVNVSLLFLQELRF